MEVEDKVQENSSLLQDNEDVFDRTDIQRNNPMEDRDFDRNQGIVIDSSEEIFDKNESLSEYETENTTEEESGDNNAAEEGWTELDKDGWENVLGSGRLRRKILTPADTQENRPIKGDYVKVSIKGTFEGEVFEEEPDLEFLSEEGETFRALELIVALMYPGETDEFIADPELVYGKIGLPPVLPGNAAAHYEVTLLEHKSGNSSPSELEIEERKIVGLRKKHRGNLWMAREEYSMAVQCYRKAVEYFDDEGIEIEVPLDRYELPEPLQFLVEERIKTYNNLAQAQLKLEAFESSLASIKQVLKLDPNNEKALFRKARALTEKGDIEVAIGTLRRVNRLYKDNKLAHVELQKLLSKQSKSREKEELMSKKMLGLDKYEEEKARQKAQRWSQNIMLGTIMGGLGVLLGGLYAWLTH